MDAPSTTPAARLLLLTDLLDMGGAETQLVDLARALEGAGAAVEFAVLRPGGALAARLSRPPLELRRRLPFDPGPLLSLRRLLRERAIDVIVTTHVWSLLYATSLRALPFGRRPRIVATVHSYRRPAASPLLDPFWRRALRSAERVIAVSGVQADWIAEEYGIARSRIDVLPNGVDLARFDRAHAPPAVALEGKLVACVARLVPEKNHSLLLDAFRSVLNQSPLRTTLALIGDGPLRSALTGRAREITDGAGAPVDAIRFLGTLSDPRPWLLRADCVVLASDTESQGLALQEAMALGRPVVATRVGGIPEFVDDGRTGLLVPAGSPTALAAAITRVLDDPDLARALGDAAEQHVRSRHGIADRARSLLETLRSVR